MAYVVRVGTNGNGRYLKKRFRLKRTAQKAAAKHSHARIEKRKTLVRRRRRRHVRHSRSR